MIKKTRAEFTKIICHKVANKFNSGHNLFSDQLIKFNDESYDLLKPFTSLTQSYRFTDLQNVTKIQLNDFADDIFEDVETFITSSKSIVKHLFEQSNSAQIKRGDVIVVYIEGIEYTDVLTAAVGIFKIENKVDFFQTYIEEKNIDVFLQKGISTSKLDKGCIILNYQDTEGPIVLSVDNVIHI